MQLKRRLSCAWLTAALLLATTTFGADEPPSLAEALKRFNDVPAPVAKVAAADETAGVENQVTAANVREMNANFRSWTEAQSQLGNLQSYFESNDYANAARTARQYARSARTPEIKKLWEDLIAALEKQQKNQGEAYLTQASNLSARVSKAALAATKPEELDPLIDELATWRELRNQGNFGSNPRFQRASQRIDATSQFLTSWQDLLTYQEAGDTENARSILRTILAQNSRYLPVSRSELTTRLASMTAAAPTAKSDLLADATLDNLAEIRERIVLAQETGSRRSDYGYNAVNDLDRIIQVNTAIDAGRFDVARQFLRNLNQSGTVGVDSIHRLRDQLIIKALPGLTGIKTLPKPEPKETGYSYIRRNLENALDKGDWPAAYQLCVVTQETQGYNIYASSGQFATNNPAAAINGWIKGQLLEKAGQPNAAAELYREAIKAGAPTQLEPKLVERLLAIGESAAATAATPVPAVPPRGPAAPAGEK